MARFVTLDVVGSGEVDVNPELVQGLADNPITGFTSLIVAGRESFDVALTRVEIRSLFETEPYEIALALGRILGATVRGVVAHVDSIGTTFEDVLMSSGSLVYPTANETWELVSTDAADASAGTGIQSVSVNSLDDAYLEQTQIVTLDGTTPVTLTGSHFRNNGFSASSVGSGGLAAGDIILRVSGGGDERGRIAEALTGDFGSHYTVPAGKTAVFVESSIFSPKNEDFTIRARFQFGPSGPTLIGGTANVYQNHVIFDFKTPLALAEKSEFRFEGLTSNPSLISATAVAAFYVYDN